MGSIKHRIGTSLFMLLPPIGLFAALNYYKKGCECDVAAIYMSIIFTIFVYITEYAVNIDEKLLQKIFAVFTISVGIYYFVKTTDLKA